MPTLTHYVEGASGKKTDRLPCPFCSSSDALGIEPDEGQTGLYYCFSCTEGGTGADFLHRVRDVPMHEAIELLGGPAASGDGAVSLPEPTPVREVPQPLVGPGLTLLEVQRLLASMSPRERQLWQHMQDMEAGERKDQLGDTLLRVFWENAQAQDLRDGR